MFKKLMVVALLLAPAYLFGCGTVCDDAADVLCGCPDTTCDDAGDTSDEACEGNTEAFAQCIVDNEDATCTMIEDALASTENDALVCIAGI